MVDAQQVYKVFAAAGFEKTHDLVRVAEFRSLSGTGYLYLIKNSLVSDRIHLVIDEGLGSRPEWHAAGIRLGDRYHSSNMRRFNERLHRGRKKIHFGTSVKIQNSADLRSFLQVFSKL